MRIRIVALIFLPICFAFCSLKTDLENLNEKDLRTTASKAIDVIKNKDYEQFKKLFAPDIAKNISEEQMNKLVNQINSFLGRKQFPDDENIVFSSYKSLINNDSVTVNAIIYKFDNPARSLHSYSRAITFNFLPKYGAHKLCGVILTDDGN